MKKQKRQQKNQIKRKINAELLISLTPREIAKRLIKLDKEKRRKELETIYKEIDSKDYYNVLVELIKLRKKKGEKINEEELEELDYYRGAL